MTLENESLSQVLEGLSPVSQRLSPEETDDLIAESDETGDSGDTVDKFRLIMDEQKK